MIRGRSEAVITGLLVCSALAVAVSVVRREFFSAPEASSGLAVLQGAAPSILDNWEDARAVGIQVGSSVAPITIVELGDVECPACRAFHETINELLRSRRDTIGYVFVHFPLSNHRFAQPAARALDCGEKRNKFLPLLDAFYRKQDSLGIKTWESYAEEAGVEDAGAIAACALTPDSSVKVAEGLAFARAIGASYTPTVLINGWRLSSTPDLAEANRIIDALLRGEAPFQH